MFNEETFSKFTERALQALTRDTDAVTSEPTSHAPGNVYTVHTAEGHVIEVMITDATDAYGEGGPTADNPATPRVTEAYMADTGDAEIARGDADAVRQLILDQHPLVAGTEDHGRAGVSAEVIRGKDGSVYNEAEAGL